MRFWQPQPKHWLPRTALTCQFGFGRRAASCAGPGSRFPGRGCAAFCCWKVLRRSARETCSSAPMRSPEHESRPMKAVILAAGKGTRMKELTNEIPKPMLRVDGKPILQHIVEGLRDAANIREFCIITGWKAEVTENYFGDGAKFGATVSYARQIVQDGTGKAPEPAKSFVGSDDFLLTYGDILVKPETYQRMVIRF